MIALRSPKNRDFDNSPNIDSPKIGRLKAVTLMYYTSVADKCIQESDSVIEKLMSHFRGVVHNSGT